jgi:hypothetical protein
MTLSDSRERMKPRARARIEGFSSEITTGSFGDNAPPNDVRPDCVEGAVDELPTTLRRRR